MSFPRYPKYKDSGVAWLCEVPAHWSVGSVRWLTRRYSGGTPDKTNFAYWEEGTIPWLNSGAVNDRLINKPSTYITAEAFENSSAKWIPEGALVMALAGQGKTKGMVAQLAIPSTCNQSMAAIIPGPEIYARFLFWWLESNYQNIRNMAGGDLRDGLNLELLGNIPCPLAPPAEQTVIAAFLEICSVSGFKSLPAEDKIRLLLNHCEIPFAIPQSLPDLIAEGRAYNWDGPLAITQIRNALVHGQPKQLETELSRNNSARHDTWCLGLWYLELALLRLFGYQGKYFNRVKRESYSFACVDTVPWAGSDAAS